MNSFDSNSMPSLVCNNAGNTVMNSNNFVHYSHTIYNSFEKTHNEGIKGILVNKIEQRTSVDPSKEIKVIKKVTFQIEEKSAEEQINKPRYSLYCEETIDFENEILEEIYLANVLRDEDVFTGILDEKNIFIGVVCQESPLSRTRQNFQGRARPVKRGRSQDVMETLSQPAKKPRQITKKPKQSIQEITQGLRDIQEDWKETYLTNKATLKIESLALKLQKIKGSEVLLERKYLSNQYSDTTLINNITILKNMVNPYPINEKIFKTEKVILKKMKTIATRIFNSASDEGKLSTSKKAECLAMKIDALLVELSNNYALYRTEEKI